MSKTTQSLNISVPRDLAQRMTGLGARANWSQVASSAIARAVLALENDETLVLGQPKPALTEQIAKWVDF